jgi:hypothetical protein
MRNAMFAMLALATAGVATVAGSGPAAAFDYPWCLQGKTWGIATSIRAWRLPGRASGPIRIIKSTGTRAVSSAAAGPQHGLHELERTGAPGLQRHQGATRFIATGARNS